MNILIYTGIEFTFEKFVLPLALELKKEGHIVYTSFNKKEYLGKRFDKNGFEFFYSPLERKISLIKIFQSIIRLIKVCNSKEIDIIHCHTPIASIVARIAGFFLKKTKVIYTCHGFYFHENLNKSKFFLFFIIEFLLSKITSKIFFVSKEDYELSIKYKFKKKKDLVFISNGVKDHFKPIINNDEKYMEREKFEIPKENFTFGIAARFVREKGFIELIHAFSQILISHPNTSLCICGTRLKGEHNDDVSFFIKNSIQSFPKNIFLIGELSSNDMPSYYRSLDTFILPSWREGLPMTILEAMMSGLPIIASNIRGCREALNDGFNGILFEHKDVTELKKAMKKILDNKKLFKMYSAKSRELALNNFTLDKNLKIQMNVFEDLHL